MEQVFYTVWKQSVNCIFTHDGREATWLCGDPPLMPLSRFHDSSGGMPFPPGEEYATENRAMCDAGRKILFNLGKSPENLIGNPKKPGK